MNTALVIGFGAAARGYVAPLLRKNQFRPVFCLTERRWGWWTALESRPSGFQINRVERDWKHITREHFSDLEVIPCYSHRNHPSEELLRQAQTAKIIATAVGPSNLLSLTEALSEIVTNRAKARVDEPLDVFLIENLTVSAQEVPLLKDRILESIASEFVAYADKFLGIVDTVIETTAVAVPDCLDVMADRLDKTLYINSHRVRGKPPIVQVSLEDDILPVRMRKLFIHNFIDSAVAYLGARYGHEYVCDAIDDPRVFPIVRGAFREIQKALSGKYPHRDEMRPDALAEYFDEQLERLKSDVLRDRVDRIVRDPVRKLRMDDRFLGPAILVKEQDVRPLNLIECIKAVLDYWERE
jgi:mannitol-1-phosphate 5-dehydrogenase